jgi:hypothetical protein
MSIRERAVKPVGGEKVPVGGYDGILQNLLLGGLLVAQLGDRRLVLLLLELATHVDVCSGSVR